MNLQLLIDQLDSTTNHILTELEAQDQGMGMEDKAEIAMFKLMDKVNKAIIDLKAERGWKDEYTYDRQNEPFHKHHCVGGGCIHVASYKVKGDPDRFDLYVHPRREFDMSTVILRTSSVSNDYHSFSISDVIRNEFKTVERVSARHFLKDMNWI